MKKLILLLLIPSLTAFSQQTVTVQPSGTGTGTFNTPGIVYYLAGPPGGTWDFSNVTVKGIPNSGGGGSGVTQILAGTNVTVSPVGGTGVVTVNSSGRGGSPGGSTGQIQYNNAGSFGGASGLTWNGTVLENQQSGNYSLIPIFAQNQSGGMGAVAETEVSNSTYSLISGITGTGYTGTILGVTGVSGFLYTNGAYPLTIGSNNAAGLSFTTANAATFSNSLAVTGILSADSGILLPFVTTNGTLYTKTTGTVVSLKSAINVMAYGADPTGVSDSTSAFNTAIAAAYAAANSALYIPTGVYSVSSVNFTGLVVLPIFADGPQSVMFVGNTSGKNILDFSGSSGITINGGFQVTTGAGVTAKTGILFAAPVASNIDAEAIQGLSVTGKFSVAACYIYGCVSSSVKDSQFTNNYTSAADALIMTSTNEAVITSQYFTVGTATNQVSDWTFQNCETHDQTNTSGGISLLLDAVDSIRWYGGNISCNNSGSNAVQWVETTGTCANLIFDGPTIYADSGHQLPTAFNLTGNINDMEVRKCKVLATAEIFAAGTNTVSGLDYRGQCGATNVFGSGNATTVTDSYIVCHGTQINITGGSITKSILIDPGSVAASTDTSLHLNSAGIAVANFNATALNDYSAGSWTPTLNSFTIVAGTGAISSTGTYIKIGHLVWLSCLITGTGTATIASTGGTSNITGQPYNQTITPNGGIYTNSTAAFTSSSGPAMMTGNAIYTGTFSAQTLSAGQGMTINFVYSE